MFRTPELDAGPVSDGAHSYDPPVSQHNRLRDEVPGPKEARAMRPPVSGLVSETDPSAWAGEFHRQNPHAGVGFGIMLQWFANAIDAGAMDAEKKRTKREREERHVGRIVDRWRKDVISSHSRGTRAQEEEKLVKALVDGWGALYR